MDTKGNDLYRDTPVRYIGYSNEVGEAFRSFIGSKLVRYSYAIASMYMLADTVDKSTKTFQRTHKIHKTLFTAADVFFWQLLASIAIPGFTINRICKGTYYLLARTAISPAMRKTLTTSVGLLSIPIIIKPIDRLVDTILDNSLRKIEP